MRVLFWICFLLTAYTYFGYLAWLLVVARVGRTRSLASDGATFANAAAMPSVSVLLAVHNEAALLPAKLADFRRIQYPAGLLEFVVVSDGSTDGTATLLEAESAWLKALVLPRAAGKAAALNQAAAQATGDTLVLCDVRQRLDADAVAMLVRHFADSQTGAVSGELLLENADGSPSADGLGIYWKIEKATRRLESATGSVIGVTGALYAVRRSLFPVIPPDTLLDDVYVPMHVALLGYRVLFEPAARVRDTVFAQPGKEFRRKVRTLTGNYQLVQKMPWLLSARNPLLGRFISHKMLRLVVPLWLLLMLIACGAAGGVFYLSLLGLQLIFYALSLVGAFWPGTRQHKPVALAYTFTLLNAAALVAFKNFVTGKTSSWT